MHGHSCLYEWNDLHNRCNDLLERNLLFSLSKRSQDVGSSMKKRVLLILLIFAAAPLTASGMELVAAAGISGRVEDVFLDGDYAYCADRYGLWVLDVSDPQQAISLGHWGSPGLSTASTVNGTVGYLCEGSGGMFVLDLTDPSLPFLLGTVADLENAVSCVQDGSYLYVAAAEDGLAILDLTDPQIPVKIGEYPTSAQAQDVSVNANLAAVATGFGGVLLLDVSDPTTPSLEVEIQQSRDARRVILNGMFLFILYPESGVEIWNISIPGRPSYIGSLILNGWATDMVMFGEALFVGDWLAGLNVYWVYNPAQAELLATVWPGGFIEAMVVEDDLLVLAMRDTGLEFWDISTLYEPEYIGQKQIAGFPQDVLLTAEDLIFEAAGDAGLRVWNADLEPGEPIEQIQTSGWANALTASENWIYLADGFGGLRIFDRSSDPQEAFYIPTGNYSGKLAINAEGNIFAAQGETGFLSLKLEGFSEPQVYGLTPTQGYIYDLSESADLLLVCKGTEGFELFDIADPAAPQLVSSYQPAGGAWCGYLENATAYVGTGLEGIETFDLTIPEAPVSMGTVEGVGWVESISSAGYGYITACSGVDGIYILSTYQTPPEIYDYYDSPGIARNASTLGATMVLADDMDLSLFGLYLGVPGRQAAKPVTYLVREPFPNPFNPTTIISFQLPEAGWVKLEVFDVNGRVIPSGSGPKGGLCSAIPTTQGGTWYSPGAHQITFDGSGLPSGIYFARLQAGDYTAVRKMVLVK